MALSNQTSTALGGLFIISLLLLWRRLTAHHIPLPPGPGGLPLLGNLLQMPTEYPWKTFAEWGKTHGDVVYTSVLQRPTIILNSAKAASALLVGKGELYAGRPVFTMYGTLVGWDAVLTMLQPGPALRAQRRLLHGVLGSRANVEDAFGNVQEREMAKLLRKVADDPEQFVEHVRSTVGTIVLLISHGYRVKETNDLLVDLNNRVGQDFSEATQPGAYLVDVFPALRYLPEWFPGAGFKQKVKEYKKNTEALIEIPHQFVKEQMAAGTAIRSFTSALLGEEDLPSEEEHAIKYAASQLYSAGVHTTVGVIHTFLLAMTLHPSIQKRAQAEIDALMGGVGTRLPTLADRAHLPYMAAILSEVLRWNPVTPLGFPRRVCEDDFYDGYFIPKNATVIPNVWQMLHDPEIYTDPMAFDPQRFMPPLNDVDGNRPERDPRDFCFGFGRRICPGMILGESSMFLACSMMLAVFDIKKATVKMEDGRVIEIEPVVDCTSGILSQPKPFEYNITPRSHSAEALIRGVVVESHV